MYTKDVVAHYGSKSAVARAIGIKKAAVSRWGTLVPPVRARTIHLLTGGQGKLAYDPNNYVGTTQEQLAMAIAIPENIHAA